MRKIIGILIAIGLVFTTPVFGKTVLVGLNDIDYQSSPDWREGMIEEKPEGADLLDVVFMCDYSDIEEVDL